MNNSELIKEIKKDKHKYNLLSLICRYRYIPKNIELLFIDKFFDKKWKLEEAVKFLRLNNIIKCVAVDCDKRNNKKDSITITSKGLKIARKLCVEITTYWSALGQSPSLARSRAVAVLAFPNGNNCINSLVLNIMLENETTNNLLQYKGSRFAAFLQCERTNFLVYNFSHPIAIHLKKEICSKKRIMYLLNKEYYKDETANRLDRIFIAENISTVIELLEVKNGRKWLYRDSEFKRANINTAIYSSYEKSTILPTVSEKMGYAYLVPIVDGFRTHIEKYYKNPIESERQISNEIGTDTYNLVVINLKTLAKIVDEISENKNDIQILIDKINFEFIKNVLAYFVKKYKFKKSIRIVTS